MTTFFVPALSDIVLADTAVASVSRVDPPQRHSGTWRSSCRHVSPVGVRQGPAGIPRLRYHQQSLPWALMIPPVCSMHPCHRKVEVHHIVPK